MRLIDAEPYAGCRIVANREDSGVSIDEIKTVDAVPVVRCGKCMLGDDRKKNVFCRMSGVLMEKDGYCSVGERSRE